MLDCRRVSPFLFKLFKDAYKEAEDTGSGFSSEISTSFVTADLNFFKMEVDSHRLLFLVWKC